MTGFETGGADVPRDRWDRPMVVPPGGGSPVAYTRATTVAGTLDDTYNLDKWKQRQVARGLSLRPDLVLRISSLGPQPPDDHPGLKTWKNRLNGVCEAAMEAAQSSAAATIGTSLHALTDRLDRGEDVGVVPDSYLPHLKAYEQATRDLRAVHIERFLVLDEYRIGGTADRVLQIDGHPKLIIGDTKSGKNIEFGLGKIEIQLAIYAHSMLYDHQTTERTPIGDIDLERGLVIALNATTGKCDLVWVDIRAGWEALQLAIAVRAHRSKRRRLTPYEGVPAAADLPMHPTPEQEAVRDLTVEAEAALVTGIRNATTREELVHLWTVAGGAAGSGVWKSHHTELAIARTAELQRRRLTAVS